DQVAASNRRPGQRTGVGLDRHDTRHHVLAGRPADTALDVNLRAVDETAAEVAEAAVECNSAAGEDPDAERVLRAGVKDGDVLHAFLVEQPAQLEIDLARRQALRVEDGSVAVDVGDTRNGVAWLDEPARVVRDHS